NILHGYNEQVRQKETLGSLLKIAKQEGIELTQRSHQYEHIKSNLQLASKLKADHIAQLQQFTLEQEMAEAPVVIVDSARVPTHPKGLSSAHRSASILLIGILFSIAFILSMDRFSVNENTQGMPMDAHAAAAWMTNPMMFWPNGQPVGRYAAPSSPMAVGDVEEVKSALGRIGNIPFQESEKNSRAFSWRSRIVHIDQQSAPAASFRQISTQLLARFGQARQSVVLTGTSRNSGKTTCASNLALLLAQAGRNVVLVDSDPQNSSLQRIFKIDKAKLRLADYNDRSGLLNKSIQKTDVDNLYVVQIDVDPRESSENKTTRLAALNSDLSQHFDWVIYDAGVIGCNTTDQLLQIVGKALFVSTDDDASGRLVTIEQIEHRGAINLGCVENAHTISQTTSRQMAFS
ncbi:MAG: AAA family ATPase, partial [Phycisphaerae bacterium]|nr:AAA family ATPase [Phycisphaerae bacterium]